MSETINGVDKGAGLWVVASLLAFKGLVSLRVGERFRAVSLCKVS